METTRVIEILNRTIHTRGKNVLDKICVQLHKHIKHAVCDTAYFNSISAVLREIPDSSGSRYYVPYHVPIAIAADEFLYCSFKDTADFIYVTPDNYQAVCERTALLLVVSSWRGLHQEWRFMGTEGSSANTAVHEMIDYFRQKGRKTVFYSKEDPPHYEHFLPIARKCEVIFTSAAEKIDDYKKDCRTDQVYLLKFGINPVYHNPIGCRVKKRKNEVVFSGSWMRKYPNRVREQRMIFDGILESGNKLKIIDRNYERNNWTFLFPAKYYRCISPSIEHRYLQKVHKLYDWAVNVNSVTDSESMFANRVYELQANGNLLLSNDSTGMRQQFAGVKVIHCKQDVSKWLRAYSDERLYEQQVQGIRRVMTGETTFDRVGTMLRLCGFHAKQPKRRAAVLATRITKELKQDFEKQSYKDKLLMEMDSNGNTGLQAEFDQCDIVALWDENSRYGQFYLEDMINAFKYTNCCYVTKNSFLENGVRREGAEHIYTDCIYNVYATVFWKDAVDYREVLRRFQIGESVIVENGYSLDHFNYCRENSQSMTGENHDKRF